MKRLVKSRLTDKQCWQCNSLLVSNTLRWVDGSLHYCPVCPDSETIKERAEGLLFWQLMPSKTKKLINRVRG